MSKIDGLDSFDDSVPLFDFNEDIEYFDEIKKAAKMKKKAELERDPGE